MLLNFKEDLEKAKEAEQIVANYLQASGYEVQDVSRQPEYYYKGDLRVVLASGEEIYIEVKDDSRIAETKNILCEEENYYKDGNYYGKGNMCSKYDIYAVVSKTEQKIYWLNFSKLKEIYKRGEYKIIDHPAQTTYCYLLPLYRAKQWGALIETTKY